MRLKIGENLETASFNLQAYQAYAYKISRKLYTTIVFIKIDFTPAGASSVRSYANS